MQTNIEKLKKYASDCSLLYVEDDELIRTHTATFLSRFFSDITLAEDGQKGLSIYKEKKFDIVITDINMPKMNGMEMVDAIKEINYEQIILVTSAHNDSEYLMRFINLNVNRFVHKPFNNKHFLYVLYKITQELNSVKERAKLENDIAWLSKTTQAIINRMHSGVIIIKNDEISMTNEAFLKICGFDSYETFKARMSEIRVLFDDASDSVTTLTNSKLIEKLKSAEKEGSRVKIIQNSKTDEYRAQLSEIEGENSYILTFIHERKTD